MTGLLVESEDPSGGLCHTVDMPLERRRPQQALVLEAKLETARGLASDEERAAVAERLNPDLSVASRIGRVELSDALGCRGVVGVFVLARVEVERLGGSRCSVGEVCIGRPAAALTQVCSRRVFTRPNAATSSLAQGQPAARRSLVRRPLRATIPAACRRQ